MKKSVSSRQEKHFLASGLFTTPLSRRQRRELDRLAKLVDSKIDTSDAPSFKAKPREVFVGRFYRPVKQQISLRVDADVLAWFRSHGGKYQTRMNAALRHEMQEHAQDR